MIYVASPYSHPSPEVRHKRYEIAESFAAFYANRGKDIYCPIASWHHIAVKHKMPTSFDFWQRMNIRFVRIASELWVLMIDGWEDSVGVAGEVKVAKQLFIPVRYFDAANFSEVAPVPYMADEEVE